MVNLPQCYGIFSTCTMESHGADPGAEARRGFDAYWTPLFGDGSFAAQLCEAGWAVGRGTPATEGWVGKGLGVQRWQDFEWWKMVENGGKWWKMVENGGK